MSDRFVARCVLSLLSSFFCFQQCCDLGYHASLARTFRTYLSAEYNLETSRHEGLDVIENAVDNLDPRNDKHKIMDMYNQVFCPPMRFEFLPHMGDEVRYQTSTYHFKSRNNLIHMYCKTQTNCRHLIQIIKTDKAIVLNFVSAHPRCAR